MKRFELIRSDDPSGVSGTGVVAEGVEFTTGQVAVNFFEPSPKSLSVFPSLAEMVATHGHGGKSVVRWIDRTLENSQPRGFVDRGWG